MSDSKCQDKGAPYYGCIIDRDFLHCYLAYQILNSLKIEKRYLLKGTERNQQGITPDLSASEDMRIRFHRSLKNLMLHLISKIQDKLGLDPPQDIVSPIEVLDAKLYLVDRFAHVELEVMNNLIYLVILDGL